MIYEITPVSKPRQTRADKWKRRPIVMRYRAYRDQVKLMRIDVQHAGSSIHFVLPMPDSWSKAKRARMNGQPHQQVPDIDNLLKGLLDAIYAEDKYVWMLRGLSKVWGEKGSIEIT